MLHFYICFVCLILLNVSCSKEDAADPGPGTAGLVTSGLAPEVSGVEPDTGIIEASQDIIISGKNFQTGAMALVGGLNCKSTVVSSETSITCSTPDIEDGADAAGDYDVTVVNPDQQFANLDLAYNYRIAPTYTELLAGPFSMNTCGSCHVGGGSSGSLRLDLHSDIIGHLVAGEPDSSPLYNRLIGVGGTRMPAGGSALPDEQIRNVYDWIWAGAKDN